MTHFINDGLDFGYQSPLQHRENTDELLSSPTPSVMRGLSTCSVSLYDLGVKSGMEFGRDWVKHTELREEYARHYRRMLHCLNDKRPHLFTAYAEGWINGYTAITSGVMV
jgi:hypothetical protein